jgi:hypothetical protein
MNQKILKIVNQIKDNLKQIDDEGVYHPLHDEIYDQLSLIEDELYTSEDLDGFDYEDEDY